MTVRSITRTELANYLHDLLACDKFNDYAPNGLQVEGAEQIVTLCTAVTASAEVISKAASLKADALLVHHGYFWRGETPEITGVKYKRIAGLIRNNINLLAYHLPLDCHKELGNNACLGKLFEARSVVTHPAANTPDLLWSGCLAEQSTSEAMITFLAHKLGRTPLCINGHDRPIQSIAWCSGGAQDFITDAFALGVDAYISGEASERTYYQAKELGLTYFACGHHATERLGIQALGEHLSTRFGLVHHFIDSDNPI